MGKHGNLGRLEAEKAALKATMYRCSDRIGRAYQCAENKAHAVRMLTNDCKSTAGLEVVRERQAECACWPDSQEA